MCVVKWAPPNDAKVSIPYATRTKPTDISYMEHALIVRTLSFNISCVLSPCALSSLYCGAALGGQVGLICGMLCDFTGVTTARVSKTTAPTIGDGAGAGARAVATARVGGGGGCCCCRRKAENSSRFICLPLPSCTRGKGYDGVTGGSSAAAVGGVSGTVSWKWLG